MAKQQFDPRRAEPGQAFDYHDSNGELVSFKADDDGVVRPKTEAEVRAANAFDLPVARSVKAEERAAATEAPEAGKENG